MHYVSKNPNLALFKLNGKTAYQFFNGSLIVGLTTTNSGTGNYIDAAVKTPLSESLMTFYATAVTNAANADLSYAGLGTLAMIDAQAAKSDYRLFLEAPYLTAGTDSVSTVGGQHYFVKSGNATYAGTTYRAGQTFITDGTTTETGTTSTPAGVFHRIFPQNECACNREEAFKMAHLQYGDESPSYHLWTNGGFDPRDEQTNVTTGVSYIR